MRSALIVPAEVFAILDPSENYTTLPVSGSRSVVGVLGQRVERENV